jgi:hypothetical protein
MNGKGDSRRPLGVNIEQFNENWDKIFLKEVPQYEQEYTLNEMWDHNCQSGGAIAVGKGEHCSWCGINEQGKYD